MERYCDPCGDKLKQMKTIKPSAKHRTGAEKRHFVAFWRWDDFHNREDDAAAYYSNKSLKRMKCGDILWLITRDEAKQKLHLVEAFTIIGQKPEFSRNPWRYGVAGNSLFDQAMKARWLGRDWFPVCSKLVGLKSRPKESNDASHFCQRIQTSWEIDQASSALLHQEASK